MDQPAGGGGGAERLGAGGLGPGTPCHQRGPGGTPPHRGRGGHRGPWRDSHQLQGGEAEDAPARLLPGRPTGPHLCGLQHVIAPIAQLMKMQKTEPGSEMREKVWGGHSIATPVSSLRHTFKHTKQCGNASTVPVL